MSHKYFTHSRGQERRNDRQNDFTILQVVHLGCLKRQTSQREAAGQITVPSRDRDSADMKARQVEEALSASSRNR